MVRFESNILWVLSGILITHPELVAFGVCLWTGCKIASVQVYLLDVGSP